MSKQAMREETERLVKEAMEHKAIAIKRGRTRIESKCAKCGALNRVVGGPRAGSGAVHVQAMRRKKSNGRSEETEAPHHPAVYRCPRGSRNRIALLSCRSCRFAIVSKKYERRLAGSPLVAAPLAVVDPSPVRRLGREGTGDGVVYKLPMLASPGCTSCSNRGLRT
jgi:hypothetical protein